MSVDASTTEGPQGVSRTEHRRKRLGRTRQRGTAPRVVVAALAAVAAAAVTVNAGVVSASATGGDQDPAPACVLQEDGKPPENPPAPTASTITTLRQAYYCIFDHSYAGPILDSRTLLVAGFAEFTKELQRRGLDRPHAILPALTGKRGDDWKAFAKRYQEVLATLPDDVDLRQALFTATMRAMVASLHDDHASLGTLFAPPGGSESSYGFGFRTLPTGGHNPKNTAGVVAPLYLESVAPGTPAAKAGLKPGDTIVAVNDVPAFSNGVLNGGVFTWLYPLRTQKDPVKVTVQRPADGTTWTVEMTPTQLSQGGGPAPTATGPAPAPAPGSGSGGPASTSATLLPGGIVKVPVPGFSRNIAHEVLKAIEDINKATTVNGVILDLRGNRGGDPAEVGKLLGAFIHDKVWGHSCDVKDRCKPEHRTDDTVPLLNLPLVVLINGQTVSAGDGFAMAVKDFGIGKLVGTRTAGIASGDAHGYLLNDNNTIIGMPSKHIIGANGEIFAGIGVPPDHYVPLTSADISAGRDPGTDKAVELFTS